MWWRTEPVRARAGPRPHPGGPGDDSWPVMGPPPRFSPSGKGPRVCTISVSAWPRGHSAPTESSSCPSHSLSAEHGRGEDYMVSSFGRSNKETQGSCRLGTRSPSRTWLSTVQYWLTTCPEDNRFHAGGDRRFAFRAVGTSIEGRPEATKHGLELDGANASGRLHGFEIQPHS
jgi:hypothetical protein